MTERGDATGHVAGAYGAGAGGAGGRSEEPLPAPGELLPAGAEPGHPLLAALLPAIRARIAAPPGTVLGWYEDSPRDGC